MSELEENYAQFRVGVPVEKYTGEARWNGIIVARYKTTRGKLRFVVDVEPQGFQMIAVGSQLRHLGNLTWVKRHRSREYDGFSWTEESPRRGYEVKEGDTLSQIAQKFYGNWHSWPVLVEANRLKDGNDIALGKNLWIPTIHKRAHCSPDQTPETGE